MGALKRPKNIVWIVIDTLRADRLGCYGYFRDTSPTIDRLASEGVLFEDHTCSALSTGAAFSCLLSGLPAISHRFYATPAAATNIMNFDDRISTLPEIIQSNTDLTTVAVDNLVNFAGHMKQTVRGFEFYINVTRDGGFPQPEYTAGEANARLLPWLRQHGGEGFFAFLHLWDPHHNPYRCPGYRDRFRQSVGSLEGLPVLHAQAGYDYVPAWGRVDEIVWGIGSKGLVRDVDGGTGSMNIQEKAGGITQDLYDCSVAYVDSEIQRIIEELDRLNILDVTVIVVTADHGEGLGIHGVWGHGLPYQDTVHIPLIMWRPGILPEGKRVRGFTQHVDVAPTLLDLLGVAQGEETVRSRIGTSLEIEVRMDGRSLLPQVHGADAGREFVVTEVRRGPSDPGYRVFVTGGWKYMETLTGKRELYLLTEDPLEKVNLVEHDPDVAARMAASLAEWKHAHLGPDQPDPMLVWPLPESKGGDQPGAAADADKARR